MGHTVFADAGLVTLSVIANAAKYFDARFCRFAIFAPSVPDSRFASD